MTNESSVFHENEEKRYKREKKTEKREKGKAKNMVRLTYKLVAYCSVCAISRTARFSASGYTVGDILHAICLSLDTIDRDEFFKEMLFDGAIESLVFAAMRTLRRNLLMQHAWAPPRLQFWVDSDKLST